jgi:hypothetical protein
VTQRTNLVICPYCGWTHPNSIEAYAGDEGGWDQECGTCQKTFRAVRIIDVRVVCQKPEDVDVPVVESEAKKRLLAWVDTNGDNFLGSGMTFQDFMLSRQIERWKNSIPCLHDRTELRRRVRLIRRLAVAMDGVERTSGVFGFAQLDMAIVAIINGDWAECQRIADELKYEHERSEIRQTLAERHATLRTLILEAKELAVPDDADVKH